MKRFIIVFLIAMTLTSCAKKNRDMIALPEGMTPISLYNRPKDVVISIGMERDEIEGLIGEKSMDGQNLRRPPIINRDGSISESQYDIYSSQLYIYYVDDIAVRFRCEDMSFPKVYYTHLGLSLVSKIRDFYELYGIPKEMETVNFLLDISSYAFAIRRSGEGFSMELLYDYAPNRYYKDNLKAHSDAYRNFLDSAIENNEESYYMVVVLDQNGIMGHFDLQSIIIGKANIP